MEIECPFKYRHLFVLRVWSFPVVDNWILVKLFIEKQRWGFLLNYARSIQKKRLDTTQNSLIYMKKQNSQFRNVITGTKSIDWAITDTYTSNMIMFMDIIQYYRQFEGFISCMSNSDIHCPKNASMIFVYQEISGQTKGSWEY